MFSHPLCKLRRIRVEYMAASAQYDWGAGVILGNSYVSLDSRTPTKSSCSSYSFSLCCYILFTTMVPTSFWLAGYPSPGVSFPPSSDLLHSIRLPAHRSHPRISSSELQNRLLTVFLPVGCCFHLLIPSPVSSVEKPDLYHEFVTAHET
eukprot:sb/3473659/